MDTYAERHTFYFTGVYGDVYKATPLMVEYLNDPQPHHEFDMLLGHLYHVANTRHPAGNNLSAREILEGIASGLYTICPAPVGNPFLTETRPRFTPDEERLLDAAQARYDRGE